jgi:hypothetical protein
MQLGKELGVPNAVISVSDTIGSGIVRLKLNLLFVQRIRRAKNALS